MPTRAKLDAGARFFASLRHMSPLFQMKYLFACLSTLTRVKRRSEMAGALCR